jgi:hypothetical protein
MPDITMCNGVDCPVKDKCYRYTSKPSDRQSYFLFPPFKDGVCEMFWGEQAESIFNQLKSITNGESNTGV